MKLIHVGAAVLNQTPLAWDQNKANILRAIDIAKRKGISILCLPELCITGYGCEDAFHSPNTVEMTWKVLQEILPHTKGIVTSMGMPMVFHHGLFNTVCLIADGRILGFVAKRFLAAEGIHYEPRWFKPWPQGERAEVQFDGVTYPLGDIAFDISGIKIGFEICEDAWVAKRPGSELWKKGVDIILNPSASHFAFGKYEVRKRLVLEGSRAFGVSYVYTNLLGCEAGRAIYDGGVIIASGGSLVATGPRFSFDDVVVTSAIIDISRTRMNRARSGHFEKAWEEGDSGCLAGSFAFPVLEIDSVKGDTKPAAWETSQEIKKEEFTRAVALGLFDYLRKTKSQGYVVSLSGGADSSAVASLVALLVDLGVKELGISGFAERFARIDKLRGAKDNRSITKALLTCVYQASENSSEQTRKAAKTLSDALGANYHEFAISDLVQRYVQMVSEKIARKMAWETDDIALQNIQARVRAPGIWLLANVHKAILLTTSNRSEAAVGYATMDGDTCGGLCPIGGIDKAFLRQWLRWMQDHGPDGIHPIPALSWVNEQQPTAELRPRNLAQTDEKDLMPYELLDAVERAAIRDKKAPLEVFLLMQAAFEQRYSAQDIGQWVEKFFQLWCINQWKRERYAPSFHLDDENLDPKTWCRFPILSGNFQRELQELRNYLSQHPRLLQRSKKTENNH